MMVELIYLYTWRVMGIWGKGEDALKNNCDAFMVLY